jgi:hypothetical protein
LRAQSLIYLKTGRTQSTNNFEKLTMNVPSAITFAMCFIRFTEILGGIYRLLKINGETQNCYLSKL